MTNAADIVILNGNLTTFDPDNPTAEAMAIGGGRITAVGSNDEIRDLAGNQTRIIDAIGGTVLPGFIDSHVHLFWGSTGLDLLDLQGLKGFNALRDAVRSYAAGRPDDPLIFATSASYSVLGKDRQTTRQDLDRILPDRPLALMAADYHTVWANTTALEKASILHGAEVAEGSEIVMAEDGTATGQLNEIGAFCHVQRLSALGGRDFVGYVTGGDPEPPATAEERAYDKEILVRGLSHCARNGITGLHNMDGNFYQLELLQELDEEGRLPCRVQVPLHLKNFDPIDRLQEADEMRRRFNSDKVWSGRVKMFMDGVLDSYTAFVLQPYPGRPESYGDALFGGEQFNEICTRADAMGLQMSVHAIGDGAVRRVLDGYEAAQNTNGARDSRHRIEHIEVIDPAELPRLAELGVVASLQPLHSPVAGLFPAHTPGDILREDQVEYAFAWRKIRASGARVCFSTDWPIVPIDVMPSLAAAMSPHQLGGLWQNQSQSLIDTLASYTRDNAWVEFNEHRKGVLKPGYMADVSILDRDLSELDPEDLKQAAPLATICEGKITYSR
ncbi:amidohydrolase [Leisingera sp. JC11]|uniref:amidohydrolase n=1 Tax=Leisingera sp. JC11 TaxID=3042469 RepID=UPI003452EAC5